jgi:hypothetical protein
LNVVFTKEATTETPTFFYFPSYRLAGLIKVACTRIRMILVPGVQIDAVAALRASQTKSFVHTAPLLVTSPAIFAEPVAARAGAPLVLRYVTTRRARIVVVMHALGG